MRTIELEMFLWFLLIVACTDDRDGAIEKAEYTKDSSVSGMVNDNSIETMNTGFDCDALFGRPNAATGLDADQCRSECDCGGRIWRVPEYDAGFISKLKNTHLDNSPSLLEQDPYGNPEEYPQQPEKLCGVVSNTDSTSGRFSYRLDNYESMDELEAKGAVLTHKGACGQCSSLEDLAVYIEFHDLTDPVRQCGVDYFGSSPQDHIACLRRLGFTKPCAQIWYFNTLHTREVCLEPCLDLLESPYHESNGEINACILCDEKNSGPVFKAVSGRTRRNSGLPTALCRPCSTITPIEHDYGLR